MKKTYNSPEVEIEKFTVNSSAITTSDPYNPDTPLEPEW